MAIYIGNICEKCNSSCLLVSVECVMDSILKIPAKDADVIKQLMDRVQTRRIKPHLGDCFSEICTAIQKANLPLDDPNYQALPTKWMDIIEQAHPLIVSGVRYEYELYTNCEKCTTEVQFLLYKQRVEMYYADYNEAEDTFLQWLKDNIDDYDCLPLTTTNPDDDQEASTDLFMNWYTTKPYHNKY